MKANWTPETATMVQDHLLSYLINNKGQKEYVYLRINTKKERGSIVITDKCQAWYSMFYPLSSALELVERMGYNARGAIDENR